MLKFITAEREVWFYRSLPSFKEYILIDQYQPVVEGYYWEDKKENLWRISNATGLDKAIPIYSLDTQIALKDIYAFIEFSGAGAAQQKLDL